MSDNQEVLDPVVVYPSGRPTVRDDLSFFVGGNQTFDFITPDRATGHYLVNSVIRTNKNIQL